MLFEMAPDLVRRITGPVGAEWVDLANSSDDLSPDEKAVYDKLCAKGTPHELAMKMAKKAAAKKSAATETTRQTGVSLAVPTDLRADARKEAADRGEAMPDGSYPIRDLDELDKARRAFGRTNPEDRPKVKRFLLKRAKALGAAQDVIDDISGYDDGSDSDGDDDGD